MFGNLTKKLADKYGYPGPRRPGTKFCAVYRHKGKEVARSKPVEFEAALALARARNQESQDYTWNAERNLSYVEEANSVKHLPLEE